MPPLSSVLSASCSLAAATAATLPNVLFILTDDQDLLLGSMDKGGPMPKTRELLVEQGAWFSNGFANTPICCPSRAEMQTGRLMHNTRVYGNDCGGVNYTTGPEKLNVAHYAKQLG
jgi:N-acetylglucosamine-6-sulfatase